ncbi:glutamate racemase [Effusibacillus lacus]|uniref:Glutamate racemase n=1 Tax=Effusibacillus lacus TaxID=1348429 RepID=A0A292YPK5_9BACL|nr:glutamate racemase [Effusibacillus lacus]TCS70055.1 glutamate racemase [Effusibacillus lacus]GAX91106.1 glutamate racemase [Effusibacillus lacus]
MANSKPIGLFDSGVGGLTVVQEMWRQLPQENLIYVGDNARCPYGSRPPEEVREYSFEIMDFLMGLDVKMIIIACNTATAASLAEAKAHYPVPVLGVITPGSRAAIMATRTGRIGVIGTEVTVRTGAYAREIHRINPRLQVVSQACPPFVKIVEEGDPASAYAEQVVEEYLAPLKREMIDTLILGCTHYPILEPVIQKVAGSKVQLISSAEETAREASLILADRDLMNNDNLEPCHRFFTTGDARQFASVANRWLRQPVAVEHLAL